MSEGSRAERWDLIQQNNELETVARLDRKHERLRATTTGFSVSGAVRVGLPVRPVIMSFDESKIVYCYPDRAIGGASDPWELLPDFLELRHGGPAEIARFVERWGAICIATDYGSDVRDLLVTERIAHYAFLSNWMQAIVNIAGRLRSGEIASDEDWALAGQFDRNMPGLVHVEGDKEVPAALESMCDGASRLDLRAQWSILGYLFSRVVHVDAEPALRDAGLEFGMRAGLERNLAYWIFPHGQAYMSAAFRRGKDTPRRLEERERKLSIGKLLQERSILLPLFVQLLLSVSRAIVPVCGHCGRYFPAQRVPRSDDRGVPLCSDKCRRERHNQKQKERARERRRRERVGSLSPEGGTK